MEDEFSRWRGRVQLLSDTLMTDQKLNRNTKIRSHIFHKKLK